MSFITQLTCGCLLALFGFKLIDLNLPNRNEQKIIINGNFGTMSEEILILIGDKKY